MVSSAYLRLLIFLPAILIPAYASSSPAFRMMYSAYKLNKQGDNIQPWHTPFPICNQSVVLCPILTVSSWPAYRLLRRQVRWSGIPISWRIFHSLFWSTQTKAFLHSQWSKSRYFLGILLLTFRDSFMKSYNKVSLHSFIPLPSLSSLSGSLFPSPSFHRFSLDKYKTYVAVTQVLYPRMVSSREHNPRTKRTSKKTSPLLILFKYQGKNS